MTSHWISLGILFGGHSDPAPVAAPEAFTPRERRPSDWDRAAAAERAEWEMWQVGYEPLGPYPGRADSPWRCRCTTCGVERRPTLTRVRRVGGCQHKRPPSAAGP